MKFNVTIDKNLINNNGTVSITDAKKVAENVAKATYDFGKIRGFIYGGMFMAAVSVAVDVVTAFCKEEKNKTTSVK